MPVGLRSPTTAAIRWRREQAVQDKPTFQPESTGPRLATLNIATTGWGGRKTVSLNGVGVAGTIPAAGLAPASLSFASQPVGTTSVAGNATLNNAGTGALSISSVTMTGANPSDFAQANNCGSSLAAGSSCTFSITFTPSASGSRAALLSVADNSAGSPQTVSLAGTGSVPAASLSPTSLSFGNQSVNTKSGTLSATLTNGGGAPLSLSSIALTGANAATSLRPTLAAPQSRLAPVARSPSRSIRPPAAADRPRSVLLTTPVAVPSLSPCQGQGLRSPLPFLRPASRLAINPSIPRAGHCQPP